MTKKILVVEDNELNMRLFNDLLEANNYQVIQARTGTEAMELAYEHKPDLVIMDIQLPEASGLEVTRWMKQDSELRHMPIIAVTAFAMKGDEERIRSEGCSDYISKPISIGHFIQTVKSHCA